MLQCQPANFTGEPDSGAVNTKLYSSKKSAAPLFSASRSGKHVSSKACQAVGGVRQPPSALPGEGVAEPRQWACKGESESGQLVKESLLPCEQSSRSICSSIHWLHHQTAKESYVSPHKI